MAGEGKAEIAVALGISLATVTRDLASDGAAQSSQTQGGAEAEAEEAADNGGREPQ